MKALTLLPPTLAIVSTLALALPAAAGLPAKSRKPKVEPPPVPAAAKILANAFGGKLPPPNVCREVVIPRDNGRIRIAYVRGDAIVRVENGNNEEFYFLSDENLDGRVDFASATSVRRGSDLYIRANTRANLAPFGGHNERVWQERYRAALVAVAEDTDSRRKTATR
jgi:hypothetical protein